MITLNLTAESQLTQMNTRFVITQDVSLSADVTIGTGCILSFQGGRLIKYQDENVDEIITITGSDTVIEAPLAKIFGDYITVAGKWKVSESYSEWFGGEEYYEYPSPEDPEITVVTTRINDANRINRACKLLSTSDAIKFISLTNNELAKLSAVTTDNKTSLTLQAKVGGNVMNLPVELSPTGTTGEYYLKVCIN